MNPLLVKAFTKAARINAVKKIVVIATKILQQPAYADKLLKHVAEDNFFKSINHSATVLNGPFKGMKYPSLASHCSAMGPKIIGSYEAELNSIIEDIIKTDYTEALDIGCAEGYYAVGLAMKMPKLTMYAFDIDQRAIKLCQELAANNGVANRVKMSGFCDTEKLANFKFTGRGLIICDCEGYEIELFKKDCIHNLRHCDILIELHDIFNPNISPTILPLFKDTHDLTIVKSREGDIRLYPELKALPEEEQKLVIFEKRDAPMEWAFLKAKMQ